MIHALGLYHWVETNPASSLLGLVLFLGLCVFLWRGAAEPNLFDIDLSFRVLFIAIIGGLGSILGNYLGALRQSAEKQHERDNVFCVVDLHAITVPLDPVQFSRDRLEAAKVLLAMGVEFPGDYFDPSNKQAG